MEEIWKDIKGHPGYHASSHGRIRSFWSSGNKWSPKQIIDTPRILKPYKVGNYLGLRFGNGLPNQYIHRIIAITFIENPNNYKEVNHLDLNKSNNNVSNLEWCSRKQNEIHKMNNGRHYCGEKHYNAKLTWKIVDYIRTSKERGYILSKELKISQKDISRIRSLQRWHPDHRP